MGVWKGKRVELILVFEYGWVIVVWVLCMNMRLRVCRNIGKSVCKGLSSCCLLLNDWSFFYDY